MNGNRTLYLVVGSLVASTAMLCGCLWDTETLASERARFPEVANLITGLFPRHSKEFHEWRIQQRKEELKRAPEQLALYDDLAVSQHKLGDHRAAIATMELKEKFRPGFYETYSNLGTFYIYAGDLDTAAEYIRKALASNAQAHFGREKYQLWLVEWIQDRKADPFDGEAVRDPFGPFGSRDFASFVASKIRKTKPNERPKLYLNEQQEAVRGVSGMMRFADFDNPILLEALGDLLAAGTMEANASHLAALCYLHARGKVTEKTDKERLDALFEHAANAAHRMPLNQFPSLLATGLGAGAKHAESIRQEEIAWIAAKADAAAEFRKKYLTP